MSEAPEGAAAALSFSLPPRPALSCGPGTRSELLRLLSSLISASGREGRRVLLLTGSQSLDQSGIASELEASLRAAGLETIRRNVLAEPDTAAVDDLAAQARSCACLVAAGGGSVLDAGKAAAAMARVEGSVQVYLEGVGTKVHPGSRLPWIALPSTAGTGAEASANAVISGMDASGRPFKRSLRNPAFMPDAVILDPDLCAGQGGSLALCRAMDALSQLLEAATSRKASPLSDAIVFCGLERMGRALPRLLAGGDDAELWTDLLLAAHCSGIGLASAGLGLPHSLAGPLGARSGLAHAQIIARVLAPSFAATAALCRADSTPESRAFLSRCARAARALGLAEGPAEKALDVDILLSALESWKKACKLPGLIAAGVDQATLDAVAAGAGRRDSLAAPGPAEAARVLAACR